jgi:hypothetical protein
MTYMTYDPAHWARVQRRLVRDWNWRYESRQRTQPALAARQGGDAPGCWKRVCHQCGLTYYAGKTDQRYCTLPCARDARNARRREQSAAIRQSVCAQCGQPFTPTRMDATTCSPACRQKAWRVRHRSVTSSA